MLEAKNITKRFGDFTAIENISFKVEPGSIYGIAGYNGAGKTTLIKSLAGIYKTEGGMALINGTNTYNSAKIRERLFYVPDDLFFLQSATMAKMAKFYAGYYPYFSMKIFTNLTQYLGLDPNKKLRGFSKGMQRQAEIIFALASRPKTMLMDECFDGLDPAKRNMVKKVFLEYAAESECSILVSSHNLSELSELCDHIGLINGKTLIVDTSVDDVSRDYRRYRIVFDNPPDRSLFDGIEYKYMNIKDKIAVFIAHGDIPSINKKLAALKPALIEENYLSLEDVFMYEMEEKEYDISKIFD